MNDFEQYLLSHKIDPVHLSLVANVRYATIYFAKKGEPIFLSSSEKITDALLRLTGIPYTGSFVLLAQEYDQLPLIPLINQSL
jgi:hypothetical protein